MNRFIALFILGLSACAGVFAQEMPAEIKAKLEAKAAELNPDSAAKAKSWLGKQITSWETLQNMSFSLDESDVQVIKRLSEKKFPLDFVSQEKYINEQTVAAANLPDFKTHLGAAGYAALQKKFEESGETNLSKFLETLQLQLAAKMEIEALQPDRIAPKTFGFAKKVAEAECAGDYPAQLALLKDFIDMSLGKEPTRTDAKSAGDDGKPKIVTMTQLDKITRDIFLQQTFLTDGEVRASVMLAEIMGKQVLLVPFANFSVGMTISNARGDTIEYNPNDIYACKTLPLILMFPKSVPEGTKSAVIINEKQYRDLLTQNVFLAGYLKQNLTSYPIRLSSITENNIIPATKIPTTYAAGSLVINPTSGETAAMLLPAPLKLKRANWMQRNEVNRIVRELEGDIGTLDCARLDKLDKWEKFSEEKFYEQKAKIARFKAVADDFLFLFTNSNMSDSENRAIIGSIIKKHLKDLKTKTDRARFERMYKAYLQDMIALLKTELRDVKASEFYSVFTSDTNRYLDVLEQAQKAMETAAKSQAYLEIVQDDIRRAQGW